LSMLEKQKNVLQDVSSKPCWADLSECAWI
jgi:hypothetical protein